MKLIASVYRMCKYKIFKNTFVHHAVRCKESQWSFLSWCHWNYLVPKLRIHFQLIRCSLHHHTLGPQHPGQHCLNCFRCHFPQDILYHCSLLGILWSLCSKFLLSPFVMVEEQYLNHDHNQLYAKNNIPFMETLIIHNNYLQHP